MFMGNSRAKAVVLMCPAMSPSTYSNMSVIFTSSGYIARRFKPHAEVGMIGINVGVPAPHGRLPFAGWRSSFGRPERERREWDEVLDREQAVVARGM